MTTKTYPLKHKKIVNLEELTSILKTIKNTGKKIIFTNGCYDILHPGHVTLLTQAKAYGDILIVALNSDVSVKKQSKGDDRPLNPLHCRAYVLAHLESVDFVISFDEETPIKLIEAICPDILIKGGDWPVDQIVGKECVEKNNGKVLSLPLVPGHSTTNILKKINKNK